MSGVPQNLAEHWNGTDWSVVPTPDVDGNGKPCTCTTTNSNTFIGMAATAANDVWAVGFYNSLKGGFQTLAEHWDGRVWSVVPTPNVGPGANALFAVAALSPTDVWAVGGFYDQGSALSLTTIQFEHTPHLLIEHWDGTGWSIVPGKEPGVATNYQQPATNPPLYTAVNALAAVDAVAPDDVWAVGHYWDGQANRTLAEHWDGRDWSMVPTPNASAEENVLTGVASVGGADVWAVGVDTVANVRSTLVEHWNGQAWDVIPSANVEGQDNLLFGVAARQADDVWAVGQYHSPRDTWPFASGGPLVERWDGQRWQTVDTQKVGDASVGNVLNGVTLDPIRVWTAGSEDGATIHQALIERATRAPRVLDFFVDVSASAGDSGVSLGRAIDLHDLSIQEGQLPAGTISWSGPVGGTTYNAALTLAVTSFDPVVLSLQRFQISLPSGQSADISNIGTVPITVPGTTNFSRSARQNVTGIGDVSFTFTGQAQIALP